jgi:MYXO-CTERM domain-containing protein
MTMRLSSMLEGLRPSSAPRVLAALGSLLRSSPLLLIGVACSTAPADRASKENVGRASSAVINGTLDTAHPAVVALILGKGNQGGLCSGTIVKTDVQRHIGWVATAAHCVDIAPTLVIQGQDFTSPDAVRYTVLDYERDSRYGQNLYDFAMVRIVGVDETTPVIPLTTAPDGVGDGTPVTSVGFGRTSLVPPSSPDDENSHRRVVQKTVDEVTSKLIGYDMATKGICQGDSGGPVLVGSGGNERVVGIHSYVQGNCNGRGYSGRVTAGLDFFNQQFAKPLPKESCSLCGKIANSGNGECAVMSASCLANDECRGYYDCLATGKKEADCIKEFPLAEGPFYAAANCVCGRACTDLCVGSLSCVDVPKCGYKMETGACSTCVERSCCQEETDCAANGQCYVCLKNNDADPACATNPARKKLATCATKHCKRECADAPIQTGGEEAPSEEGEASEPDAGGETTTITKSGCSTSAGTSSSSALVLAMGALVLAGARRRRRD